MIIKLSLISVIILFSGITVSVFGQEGFDIDSKDPICGDKYSNSKFEPILTDPSYKIEKVVSGLDWPTTMTFVGNDILVLQKNDGLVCHVKNGVLQEKPALIIDVNSIGGERGLLGITTKDSDVYIFFTGTGLDGENLLGSYIYKYSWNGKELTKENLVKKIKLTNELSDDHIGGAMTTHFDGTVYAVIGDNFQEGINQNVNSGEIDDTGTIISLNSSEEHYAIGIRNSFGITVDPVTGNIWETENGPDKFDEVNLVLPKFNSGWKKIMGPGSEEDIALLPNNGYIYSDPEFSWETTVAPTSITFVESEFFKEFSNSILVGGFSNGNLYKFQLNDDRTSFVINDPLLADLVVNKGESMDEILFGLGFAGITDIEIGPDGMIYIVSIGDGIIYKIIPADVGDITEPNTCSIESGVRMNLSGCNLSGLLLENRSFRSSDLSNINLSGADLSGSSFSFSNLTGADLRGANIADADFTRAILSDALLQDADLSGADLKHAFLVRTDLENAKMNSAILDNVNLDYAILKNADLSKVKMKWASLKNANLNGANLSYTDLRVSDISNASLQKANLSRADIHSTNFSSSDLSGSNLLGVYPYSTDFTDVIFSEETKTDSCLDVDFLSRTLNKILRELRQLDNGFLEPIQSYIIQMCKPR